MQLPQRNVVVNRGCNETSLRDLIWSLRIALIYRAFFLNKPVARGLLSLPMVKTTDRRPLVPLKIANQIFDDADIFEIDRSNLALQLRAIRRAIHESAEEMELVALEGVFVEPVSRALTRTARKLYRLSEDLNGLYRMIEEAHPPKAPGRPQRNPTPRNRRRKPN
jgi:hypothetical protein